MPAVETCRLRRDPDIEVRLYMIVARIRQEGRETYEHSQTKTGIFRAVRGRNK